jgi:hypothetical protein
VSDKESNANLSRFEASRRRLNPEETPPISDDPSTSKGWRKFAKEKPPDAEKAFFRSTQGRMWGFYFALIFAVMFGAFGFFLIRDGGWLLIPGIPLAIIAVVIALAGIKSVIRAGFEIGEDGVTFHGATTTRWSWSEIEEVGWGFDNIAAAEGAQVMGRTVALRLRSTNAVHFVGQTYALGPVDRQLLVDALTKYATPHGIPVNVTADELMSRSSSWHPTKVDEGEHPPMSNNSSREDTGR